MSKMEDNLTIAYFIKLLAEEYGDREAIHFKSPFRTFCFKYRDIHKRSLLVANYLYEKGIRKGDKILVWSYNSQEYDYEMIVPDNTNQSVQSEVYYFYIELV